MTAIHLPLGQPLQQTNVQSQPPRLLRYNHRSQLPRITTNRHVRWATNAVVGGDDGESAGEVGFGGLSCFVDEEEAEVGFGEGDGGLRVDGVEDVELEGGEVVVGTAGGEEERGVEDGAANYALREEDPVRRRGEGQLGARKKERRKEPTQREEG